MDVDAARARHLARPQGRHLARRQDDPVHPRRAAKLQVQGDAARARQGDAGIGGDALRARDAQVDHDRIGLRRRRRAQRGDEAGEVGFQFQADPFGHRQGEAADLSGDAAQRAHVLCRAVAIGEEAREPTGRDRRAQRLDARELRQAREGGDGQVVARRRAAADRDHHPPGEGHRRHAARRGPGGRRGSRAEERAPLLGGEGPGRRCAALALPSRDRLPGGPAHDPVDRAHREPRGRQRGLDRARVAPRGGHGAGRGSGRGGAQHVDRPSPAPRRAVQKALARAQGLDPPGLVRGHLRRAGVAAGIAEIADAERAGEAVAARVEDAVPLEPEGHAFVRGGRQRSHHREGEGKGGTHHVGVTPRRAGRPSGAHGR